MECYEAIKRISKQTDKAILFHSATGKDSIVLLDMLTKHFAHVIPVFMYVVKDLQHVNTYIDWAQRKYNVRFIQTPHFALYSYIKSGFLGCEQNERQRLYRLQDIDTLIKKKTGTEWSFYGMKKTDSLNRRLMLGTYTDGMTNEKSKKCYPLADWNNARCLRYIEENGLIKPEKYGAEQSSGTSVNDAKYLRFLKEKHPDDLERVFEMFPHAKAILYEYEYNNQ